MGDHDISQDRERELKLHLHGHEDYVKLTGIDGPGEVLPTVVQTNHYFDTRDQALLQNATMLRLRVLGDGRVVFTFKQGREDPLRPGFFDALEIESEVEPELVDRALADAGVLLESTAAPARILGEHFGEPALEYLGTLSTLRRRRRVAGFLVELDEVTYSDGSKTYELEVETDDPDSARAMLEAELGERGIRWTTQSQTKLEGLVRRGSRG